VHCGNTIKKSHDDHIPGKQFFPDPKPQPSELIKVPSCLSCNIKFQPYENYVRSHLLFGPAGVSQAGEKLWEQKLNRTYQKDIGLKKIIANSLQKVELRTQTGLYAGKGFVIKTRWDRVSMFITKLVRGLYYFESRRILPVSTHIDFPHIHAEYLPASEFKNIPARRYGKKSWKGIFEYRFDIFGKNPQESIWVFRMYGHYIFIAITCKPEDRNIDGERKFEEYLKNYIVF
jgi:hypothetical protein